MKANRLLFFTALAATLAVVTLVVCLLQWMRPPPPEWTTRSPRALKEFESGLKALAKNYKMDAVQHFEEALELDPSFTMAKLQLATLYPSRSERRRLYEELRQVETQELKAREQFLLAFLLARFEQRDGDAQQILNSFLEQHPQDPFGLWNRCEAAWHAQAWDDAEQCYDGLLELHPNRVEAWNHLGYLALARGRFDEAEERFRTYRYLAPDQANPYHSLAVLATIRGRYAEAESELAETIRIKPDFCEAYTQRVDVGFLSGQYDMATTALADLEQIEECSFLEDRGVICALRAWVLYLDGDAEGAWRQLDDGCLERLDGFDVLAHRIAVMTGRIEEGIAMEKVLNHYRDKVKAAGRPIYARLSGALLDHMQGIRHLVQGNLGEAIERLKKADQALYYWGGERASIKLFNRLNLLRTLELAGRRSQAAALRREIEEINPRLVDTFPLPGIEALRSAEATAHP